MNTVYIALTLILSPSPILKPFPITIHTVNISLQKLQKLHHSKSKKLYENEIHWKNNVINVIHCNLVKKLFVMTAITHFLASFSFLGTSIPHVGHFSDGERCSSPLLDEVRVHRCLSRHVLIRPAVDILQLTLA